MRNLPFEDKIAELNKKLRALRKQAKTAGRREANGGLTDWQKRLVVATYVLSDYDTELAERVGSHLVEQAFQQGFPTQPLRDPVPVRDWFLSLPPDQFDPLFLPVTNSDCYLRQQAIKMIAEVQAVRWVRDQNFGRGVAPPACDVAEEYASRMAATEETAQTEVLLQSARSVTKNGRRYLRKWARAFRQRWGVANTHLPTLDAPARADIGGKARHGILTKFGLQGFLGSTLESDSWQGSALLCIA